MFSRWFKKEQAPEPFEWKKVQQAHVRLQHACYLLGQEVLRAMKQYGPEVEGCRRDAVAYYGRPIEHCLFWNEEVYGDWNEPKVPVEKLEALMDALRNGLLERVKACVAKQEEIKRQELKQINSLLERLEDSRGTLVTPSDPPLLKVVNE